ncbi:MAG: hypothetical protein SGBAC_001139 [Bacillariaceae sp.]
MNCSYSIILWILVGLIQTSSSGVFALSSPSENVPIQQSLELTSDPPLLDVPTYSLATQDKNGQTGMNIVTYASPISIRPDRIWSLGLFKGTWTHEQFALTGEGVLQLLAPEHSKVVRVLGGSSTREVNKQEACTELDMPWIPFSEDGEASSSMQVLPGCVHYLKVRLVGDLIDCGSHDLAMCKVESMFVPSSDEKSTTKHSLMTSQLREMGIITAQGRVAEE